MAAPRAALLLLALALAAPRAARAHRPLLSSPVGGAAHSTWQGALPVPWVTTSWSVKRVVEVRAGAGARARTAAAAGSAPGPGLCALRRHQITPPPQCGAPVFWMRFAAERTSQDVHLTAGTPAAAGLAGTRPALALFGPGLPPYNASALECARGAGRAARGLRGAGRAAQGAPLVVPPGRAGCWLRPPAAAGPRRRAPPPPRRTPCRSPRAAAKAGVWHAARRVAARPVHLRVPGE